MSPTKRAAVHLDPTLHRALRLKAAGTGLSISDLVNDAVRASLAEDADDLAAVEDRRQEPSRPFEAFVKDMKRRGRR